ncbi:MAG: MOSC domain-containing protein [Sulfurimonas sp.]|uniref:MOSC domain-containing protein n=1 Tax=Sulfurimonas sp. TaxID=2022749 RepID=UPI0025F3D4FD|nr:MOSC domain-containing protein [Sulfurimonas sp.]MCK9491761.1 MOSC domain-containing protein [Sulfurimonas sp.]
MKKSISKVLELKVGSVETIKLEDSKREFLVSAIKKKPTPKAYLTKKGFSEDEQGDTLHHGGENKALFLFSASTYEKLNSHFESNFDFRGVASFGENLILSDICESDICIGDIFEIGEAIVQITQPRQPCWKLSASTKEKDMTKVTFLNGFTGWYAKVLKEGYISKEDEVILQKRAHKNLTIAKLNELIVDPMSDEEATKEALLCDDLGRAFLVSLTKRYEFREKDDQFSHYHT